jgi:uncharacterized phage protein (TIGR02218 family)
MRTVGGATAALIGAKIPFFKADLYTFTLAGGTVYRWTDFDQDILLSLTGATPLFLAQGPCLHRSSLGVKNTVEVPELVITLSALDTDFVGGLNIKTQLHNGFFDGATVALDRCFFAGPKTAPIRTTGVIGGDGIHPTGGLFSGRMSQAKITAIGAELTVKGANVLMNQYVPRNAYQVPCLHTFCDPGCTLLEATFTTSNTAAAGSTRAVIQWGSVPGSPRNYTFGKLTMTSGAASGQVRTIKSASAAGIVLQYPLYNTPAPGDTYNVMKGCSKGFNDGSGQDCTTYANTPNYRGFEFTPTADNAL